ncbi:hypothetical protein KIK06_24865 [Nocardiopsis sp. EMB25]|uniref:hypothetical protein n=1 Tax=Nocardiopsis sp. EMB25 TaxID=2835867 RepID=UPI00228420D2|nr:hypothetical protein [Nocardiopsis sp. EMB25]MCY9787121.1 hypothetical protein [Nocardiopsis sp. EMB25]
MTPTTQAPYDVDDLVPAPTAEPGEPPEDPTLEPEPAPPPAPEPEREITDDPQPPPEDPRQQDGQDTTGTGADGDVFDCGLVDPGCHVSNWFADFVVSGLNPALGWLAEKAFHTPLPSEGMKGLHAGILTTANVLFVLLVVAGGLVVMGYRTFQDRYSVGEILPRIVFAFVAANSSLWMSTEIVRLSNGVAAAIGADGINAREAAANFRDRLDVLLAEAVVFTILLLVVAVVLLVVWMVTEAVRICTVIVLVVAAPVLLAFHALPQTNRIAELWWKLMAGLCAIPIAQSLVFITMMRLFFEGQMTLFGSLHPTSDSADDVGGADWLMQIMLLLVLLYTQIRIPVWVKRLIWEPTHPGSSPIAALLRNLAWMLAFRSLGNLRMPGVFTHGLNLGLKWPHLGWPSRTPGRKLPRYTPGPPKGVQPLRPQAWWYRPRHEAPEPIGALPGPRAALPGPGGGPSGPRSHGGPPGTPGLLGPRALPPVPDPRVGPRVPARHALEEGRIPGSPRTGQQVLFGRPTPGPPAPSTAAGPVRRWRQGVLPTPPPVRVPGRRAPERVGDAWARQQREPRRPAHVKGQRPLFPNPKRMWKQYGLFPRPKRDS